MTPPGPRTGFSEDGRSACASARPGRPGPLAVTWAGLVANVCLSAAKISAGLLFGSQAILADGLHSGSDLLTDAAVLVGLRYARRPADGDHHYGHGRVSALVALFVGASLLGAAGWITWTAIETLRHPHDALISLVPLTLAGLSVVVKEGLYQVTVRVGRRTRDLSLEANAWHHRSDAFSSLAAAAGLTGVWLGGPEWAFLDHLTAVVLAAFLVATAAGIIHRAGGELLDRAPGPATLRRLAATVDGTPGVAAHHAFRVRELAGRLVMDLHVQVDPELSVRHGHDIASTVEGRLRAVAGPGSEAVVHIEPDLSAPTRPVDPVTDPPPAALAPSPPPPGERSRPDESLGNRGGSGYSTPQRGARRHPR